MRWNRSSGGDLWDRRDGLNVAFVEGKIMNGDPTTPHPTPPQPPPQPDPPPVPPGPIDPPAHDPVPNPPPMRDPPPQPERDPPPVPPEPTGPPVHDPVPNPPAIENAVREVGTLFGEASVSVERTTSWGRYFSRRNDTLGFAVDTTFTYPKALNTSLRDELDPTGSHAGGSTTASRHLPT
jgi:outer membrane biosynthesis protein TonB